MDVALLYFDDCPNWFVADERLSLLRAEYPQMSITPSILVNGIDPFADVDDPVGLSCRVYQTPDGPAGSPTLDQLREAVAEEAA